MLCDLAPDSGYFGSLNPPFVFICHIVLASFTLSVLHVLLLLLTILEGWSFSLFSATKRAFQTFYPTQDCWQFSGTTFHPFASELFLMLPLLLSVYPFFSGLTRVNNRHLPVSLFEDIILGRVRGVSQPRQLHQPLET